MDMLPQILDALLGDRPIERVMIAGMAAWITWQQRQLHRIQERRVEGVLKIADAAHIFAAALERNTDALKSLGADPEEERPTLPPPRRGYS